MGSGSLSGLLVLLQLAELGLAVPLLLCRRLGNVGAALSSRTTAVSCFLEVENELFSLRTVSVKD